MLAGNFTVTSLVIPVNPRKYKQFLVESRVQRYATLALRENTRIQMKRQANERVEKKNSD